jgi:hypothetical protein
VDDLSASAKPRLRLLLDHFLKIEDTRQKACPAIDMEERTPILNANRGSRFGLMDCNSGLGAGTCDFSATVLHNESFGALAGIATIIVCLTLNQVAYLIGAAVVTRGSRER